MTLLARLTELVGTEPGRSARELANRLGDDKSTVNALLYSNRSVFVASGTSPPLWRLAGDSPINPGSAAPAQPGISARTAAPDRESIHPQFDHASLYSWQTEALAAWRANGQKGIVEAVTGAGKTKLGLAAIDDTLRAGGKAAVIVPTIELVRQWRELLATTFPGVAIGQMGDGRRDFLDEHTILVATANSAREYVLGLGSERGLLVADECHRYGSAKSQLALEEEFDARLGLSATYRRSDRAHETVLEPYFHGVVFELGYRRAIKDGVVARFRVGLLPVELSPSERQEYDGLSEQLSKARWTLVEKYGVPEEPFEAFLAAVHELKNHGTMQEGIAAGRWLSAFIGRQRLLAETPAKLAVLDAVSPAIKDADRTIVFTQTINGATAAVDRLATNGIRAKAIHSGLEATERKSVLDQFATGALEVVVAPRVLDEGVDVPAADLAVILAASQQRRQMIQRMGRVLRKKADGREARFAIAYVRNTGEDPSRGAHEAFLSEILDVAEEVHPFPARATRSEIRAVLSPQHRAGGR